jgi:hypothetical protein
MIEEKARGRGTGRGQKRDASRGGIGGTAPRFGRCYRSALYAKVQDGSEKILLCYVKDRPSCGLKIGIRQPRQGGSVTEIISQFQ